MSRDSYPCPSCGFLVFSEPPGSYGICPFCGWEDDHVQLAHPTMRGGANGQSLVESQLSILKKLPLEIREHKGILRDCKWRPLQDKELNVRADAPKDGLSYFQSACDENPTYYWLLDEEK